MSILSRVGQMLGLALLFLGVSFVWLDQLVLPSYASSQTNFIVSTESVPEGLTLAVQDASNFSMAFQPAITNHLFMPLVEKQEEQKEQTCVVAPDTEEFRHIQMPSDGTGIDHPDYLHADLNLAVRGSERLDGPALNLLNLITPVEHVTPTDALRLSDLFDVMRIPTITTLYDVYDWDWDCSEPHGCPISSTITHPLSYEASLLGIETKPGEVIHLPDRGGDSEIYAGGIKAVVVYAEEERITLSYNHADGVAVGYALHLEGVCVDPKLVSLYKKQNNEDGFRNSDDLPALTGHQILGTAAGHEIRVAVRYYGNFMDPRSVKEWWSPIQITTPLSEDFSSGLPNNWQRPNDAIWTTANPGLREIGAPFDDSFAIMDSINASRP